MAQEGNAESGSAQGHGMDHEMGGCCQGMKSAMAKGREMPQYDSASEVTLEGTIEEVREHPGMRGGTGIHLALRTDQELLEVHLGPAAFLISKDISFAPGDRVEVKGSRIQVEDVDALLAREVKKGEEILTLRNERGEPVWARAGQKPRP
jgi:hypothetical protein